MRKIIFLIGLALLLGIVLVFSQAPSRIIKDDSGSGSQYPQYISKEAASIRKILDEGYTTNVKWIPGQDKVIANVGGNIEILDTITGKRERILKMEGKGVYTQLVLSSDGNRFIFKNEEGIFIYKINEKQKKKLPIDREAESFAWSPDDKQIAYKLNDEIWITDVDGGTNAKITPAGFRSFRWSPKGDKLAVGKPFVWELWIVDSEDAKVEKILENVQGFEWFPDGERIAFTRGTKLLISDIEKNIETEIGEFSTPNVGKLVFSTAFSISSDGRYVAYNYGVFEMNDDWQPNERWPQVDSEIYIYDVQRGETINVTNTPDQWEVYPLWSSDGKKIFCFLHPGHSGVRDREPPSLIPLIIELGW